MPIPVEQTHNRQFASRADSFELREARFAMRLSLAVGLLMLIGKTAAYFMTHSAAIFSDAAESVVHVVAVVFAAFSLRLSSRPAEARFLYGYDRIVFFSAGFEGAMIILAAIAILVAAIHKWLTGLYLENLGIGTYWWCLRPECSTRASGTTPYSGRPASKLTYPRSKRQTRSD